jgi:hypothetical protein
MSDNIVAMSDKPALFEAAVVDSFSFLERDYGFSKQITRPNQYSVFARYENAALYVNVMFGPPAYEPEMSFGRLEVDDVPGAYNFTVGDLSQLSACQGWTPKVDVKPALAADVAWMALFLRECGRLCLENDAGIYGEMKARRDTAIAKWHREELDKAAASQIEAAWKAKDYKAVVDICSAFDGTLSAVDGKRLAIAMERA